MSENSTTLADIEQAGINQADIKQADIKQVGIKLADLKQADVKQADIKPADIKQAGIKLADIKQAGAIFGGLNDEELNQIILGGCVRAKSYARGSVILRAGSTTHELGILLKGGVHIENVDVMGNKSILSHVGRGQVFAETYALCGEPLMVDVVAAEECEILFLDLTQLRAGGRGWQGKVSGNLLTIATRKNLVLSERIFCTAPKSVRGRALTYLTSQSLKAGSRTFAIPFNREQMADYLNLDRSALSKELCRMRDEGIIKFRKNVFTLLTQD